MHPIPLGERVALAVVSDSDAMASYRDDGDVLMLDSQTGEEIEVQGSSRWLASDLCTVTTAGEVLLTGQFSCASPGLAIRLGSCTAIENGSVRCVRLRLAVLPCSPALALTALFGCGTRPAASKLGPSKLMGTDPTSCAR
jgi:hypothetical protein